MFKQNFLSKPVFRIILTIPVAIAIALSGIFLLPDAQQANAAATLTIAPLTWNVIGLDSNNVSVGPNNFPVGARVCNEGTTSPADDATGVVVDFVWDDGLGDYNGDAYINLRSGSLSVINVGDLAAGDCYDAYFEVTITRDSDAYDETRRYHITADSTQTSPISTPRPREIFVEHLVSQSRNYNMDVKYSTTGLSGSFSTVPAGGSMTLMVGGTYWIELDAKTATNGYEQIESYINFPNTVFQVEAVTTTYLADTSANIPTPDNKLYGDGCTWENNPNDPSYRSCLGVGKAGGDIVVIYQVKILSVPSINPEPLNAMIYDFSGSSYHYNSDYAVSVRYANIVNASIVKAFSPKIIQPGGTSTLTFTISNPGPQAISGVNFSDTLPSGMEFSSSTVTYTGCGTPSPSSITLPASSISFTNITVSALSTCTIAVRVTAPANDTYYENQSGNLYIGTTDTGSYATDTMLVSTKPAPPSDCGTSAVALATWDFTSSTSETILRPDVGYANATYSGTGSSGVTSGYWWGSGWRFEAPAPTSDETHFQFSIDTSNYGGVSIEFQTRIDANGKWTGTTNYIRAWQSADSATFETVGVDDTNLSTTFTTYSRLATTTGSINTQFRIQAYYRKSQNPEAQIYLDNVTIKGCPRTTNDPTLSKAFQTNPIIEGGTSTLRFTFTNPNTATSLTSVGFTDTLPAGLVVDTTYSGAPTCTSGSISGQTITATAGSRNISMSNATLTANSACYFDVSVRGDVAGTFTNISSNITSTETGPNVTSSGYGTSNLTVIAPPVITKLFGETNLITNDTTTLTFLISNPNIGTDLTGVDFTDSLDDGYINVASIPNITGPTCAAGSISGQSITTSSTSISLSGATLSAGAVCTFSVDVTGVANGLQTNSVTISSTNGGTGNTYTANILVRSETPKISIMKQVGLTDNLDGAWYSSKLLTTESSVYYKFTVENTGDVDFSNFSVTDPTLNPTSPNQLSCTWYQANTYPTLGYSVMSGSTLRAASNGDPTAYCVVGPVTTQDGFNPNTATAHGTYNSTDYTSTDTASYTKGGNFGHLPYSAYPSLNVFDEGGAMHVNDAGTTLGESVTTTWLDGSTSNTYSTRTTDDGIEADHTQWAVGAGNEITVTVTCTNPSCYVYGWFDWNKDGDFDDEGETLSRLEFTTTGVSTQILEFSIPNGTSLVGDFYSRFRVYSDLPEAPSPYGLAVDDSGNALEGEIEDYKWPYGPTAVTLSLFDATAIYRQVTLNWVTELEYNTVGFNIYRSTSLDNKPEQININIIPSLLLMGKTPPFEYLFVDSNVLPGVAYFYWLEEIATDGKEMYGPIQVNTPEYGLFLPLMRR